MAEKLKIAFMNCRGLADKIKRLDVFNYFRKKKFDIVCLQDIHIEQQNVDKIRTEWGSEAVLIRLNLTRGVLQYYLIVRLILKLLKQKPTEIAHIETMEKIRTITNIYGPNSNSPEFYDNIKKRMEQYHDTSHIMCGDFNLVMDPIKDYENYSNVNKQNSIKKSFVFNQFTQFKRYMEIHSSRR